jgi:chorismate dehydratase
MIRVAASTYLNSAPLVDSIARGRLGEKYHYVGDTAPSRCAAMLAAGVCEIALIPVIEYQRIPGLRVLPGLSVASKERVRSVLLASRSPLSEVRSVALDSRSRTSQALVRILLRHRYGVEGAEWTERTPEGPAECQKILAEYDAALVIGDPAMRLEAAIQKGEDLDWWNGHLYDLATEWRAMTGHPFVFAVWAVRADRLSDPSRVLADFHQAREEGLARREEIAQEYAVSLGLPEEDLFDYLCHNVHYRLDGEDLAGLKAYYRLALTDGLIEANQPLRFLGEQASEESALMPPFPPGVVSAFA